MNSAKFIRNAIDSVLAQNYTNFEHIIIDGGSTDGTVEILKEYPHLLFISEPDKNLYDAINKGIRLAHGEIIGHLNSDDFYLEDVFGEIACLFQQFPDADLVCGKASVFEDDPKTNTRKIIIKYEGPTFLNLSIENITLQPPIINAKFFRKSLYERFGKYNIDYPIASDREFLLRIAVNGVKSIGCEKMVYNYRQHPESLTIGTSSRRLKIKMLKEDLKLSELYLKKYGHIRNIHHILTRWHTKISIHLLVLYIRQRIFKDAFLIINSGLKYDIQFPISLVLLFAQSILIKKG